MQARIVGILAEIQTDGIDLLRQIIVGELPALGKVPDLGIVLLIPVRIQAGGFDEHQFHAVILAKLRHLFQIVVANIPKLVIGQRPFSGKLPHR